MIRQAVLAASPLIRPMPIGRGPTGHGLPASHVPDDRAPDAARGLIWRLRYEKGRRGTGRLTGSA